MTEEYTEHLEMAKELLEGKDNYGEVIDWNKAEVDTSTTITFGPQVLVVNIVSFGPREVDTFAVAGFYIPHNGQCTVAINHMDGLITHDNAEDLFPNA